MNNYNFFINKYPRRPADYTIGCCDCSVYMDFKMGEDGLVSLIGISFDCYGYHPIGSTATPLNQEDSDAFKHITSSAQPINKLQSEILDQDKIAEIVKKAIQLNRSEIWEDALKEYELI